VLLVSQARLSLKLSPAAIITMENYLLSVNPSSAETWALLAQAYSQSGRANDALQANSRALQLSGNAIDARLTRGLVFLEQGDYEKACEDLNVALEQDPESYEGRNGRAQCAYELGDVKQAIEDLEFVRKITPGRPDVDTLYVKALVADEQWNKAISAASSAFNRGVLSPSQRADVLEAQGYAFYQVGDYNNGFLNLNAAIQIADTGTRHYYLGLIFEALRDYPRALQEYQWVVFWSEIYDYPFTEDAQARAEELGPIVQAGTPTPTPTSSPTPTATATSPATATPPGGTSTPTPRPSNTPGATRTPTPKPSATP
jgi:tetratricopeptide (TPR) repeat protein